MPQDRLTICNLALGLLGEDRIQSLDDGSRGADLAKDSYPLAVRQALEDCPWNFAEECVRLAADAVPKRPDFTYSYERPRDFVAVRQLLGSDGRRSGLTYKLTGNRICSDEATPWLVYTYTAPEHFWTGMFSWAVAYLMAHYLAGPITEDAKKVEYFYKAYRDQLARARSRDAQQDTPESFELDGLVSWHAG